MNKLELVAVFVSIIILLSVACGVLFYQKQIAEQEVERMEKEIELREEELADVEEELETVKQQLDRVGEELECAEKIASTFQINITGLTVIDTGQYRGMTQYSTVNVTVQNFGTHDVRSLLLSVRYAVGDTYETKSISILKAGEAQTFTFTVTYSVLFTGASYIATLKAENVILDEYNYPPTM